ncbi:hypothetical protein Tco_0975279 [Tanacetum coccineum]|uniref:Uncharacterized protein n=1 Tax=Tanacetum coccineum TaxID=301880 RepID=A0ABQ5EF59_9ASTR
MNLARKTAKRHAQIHFSNPTWMYRTEKISTSIIVRVVVFLIPIPAPRDISNPDELCKTEEFIVIKYSMGSSEEFATVSPSKVSTVERTPGSMCSEEVVKVLLKWDCSLPRNKRFYAVIDKLEKPSRRVAKAKKDEPKEVKETPKEWTVEEEIALCQASGGLNLNEKADEDVEET